ncbi:hypothetical protein ACE6H2_015081 [Prunus campanulata]
MGGKVPDCCFSGCSGLPSKLHHSVSSPSHDPDPHKNKNQKTLSASPPKGSKRHGVVIGKEVPSKPKEKLCPKAASSSSSSASKSRMKLVGGYPSIDVVESIICSGWVGEVGLRIEKVLRVHHSLDVLHGFEE